MPTPIYDTSKPVMVTGATGYLAGWIVKDLLEKGLTVHAPVRAPNDASKLATFRTLPIKARAKLNSSKQTF